MTNIQIRKDIIEKPMKPMHAGGQPPLGSSRRMNEYFHYLTEAGIPYSRLHDVGGLFGSFRFVDVPNIFRDFDADENDPASYDFTFTDLLIEELVNAGVEPYFRLGVTIECQAHIKYYRITPPSDVEKWARVCEHIVRHYTEGWANGYRFTITYWEIWNEPDDCSCQPCWRGTNLDYFNLYTVTAKHLKACFPRIKVGGYASCGCYGIDTATDRDRGGRDFFWDFLAYIKEHGAPLDFFSWHAYEDVTEIAVMDAWIRGELDRLGYEKTELHLNEWNPYHAEFGTGRHSAEAAAVMVAMQHGNEDVCCIYDMRTSDAPYCPLFDVRTHEPHHAYYSLVAFNRLYRLGSQIKTVCDNERMYVLAASNGKQNAAMIVNLTGERQELALDGVNDESARYYAIDDKRLLSWAPNAKDIGNNTVLLIEWDS